MGLKTCEKIGCQTEFKKKKKKLSNFNLKRLKKSRNENENKNMYKTSPNYLLSQSNTSQICWVNIYKDVCKSIILQRILTKFKSYFEYLRKVNLFGTHFCKAVLIFVK